ncbi:hypothetical protein F0562_003382 [Nyssa sinensis]|uniref:Uncharacterized protein n=1 Tax=Nyssa sinensis TaxID=561372 RepID=A0A5J5BV05_9ASTE|nr:hypothetical protein F0562_003382 [Nyssa sinensis]
MASNLPLNANIIDCPPTNDDLQLVQAHVSLSQVHGEDGTVREAEGAAESVFSPIILNANISNVHGQHDLSALLIESRLDSISEGVDGAAREDMIRVQPLHGRLCGRRGVYSSSHQEGLSLQARNKDFPLDNSETHRGDGQPTLEKQQGENIGTIPLVRPTLCGKKGLTKKVANDQYPLGTSGTYEQNGRPSQDKQKIDGTAAFSSDLGGNRVQQMGTNWWVMRLTKGMKCKLSKVTRHPKKGPSQI